MEIERYRELMEDTETRLTEKEMLEGWHFCYEWDGLLICRSDPEWGNDTKRCRCGLCYPIDIT